MLIKLAQAVWCAFKIVTQKFEAKWSREGSKCEQVENIKICFIEGCQTRGLDPVCFGRCSHERRNIFWFHVVLLPSK